MSAPVKFRCFHEDLGRKVHDLDADALKVLLTDQEPPAGARRRADLAEIAAAPGYPAGGLPVPDTEYADAGGAGILAGGDVVFAAAGGAPVGPFRYAVLYNASAPGGALIGYWDRGSPAALTAAGDEFAVRFAGREILTVG